MARKSNGEVVVGDKPSASKMDVTFFTVQGLETIIAQREKDLDDLAQRRANLMGQITDLEKELQRNRSRLIQQADQIIQQADQEISERKNELNQRDVFLNRWNEQLGRREKEVSDMEQRRADIDKKEREIEQQALTLERLRVQSQQEYEKAGGIRADLEAEKESIRFQTSETARRESDVQLRESRVHNLECEWDNRIRTISLREKVVDDAARGLEPKLSELQIREEALEKKENELTDKENRIKELDMRVKEAEEILEKKSREYDAKIVQIAQEEALIRQRKIELMAKEDRMKEK